MNKVSVIVPNYNHERFLSLRLDSIIDQSYTDFEIIILDDNSTDRSREIIERYRANPKVTSIVYNYTNGGSPFGQWAKGIMMATGEYIWIAESDDYAAPGLLDELILLTNTYQNVAIAYCHSYKVNEHGEEMDELNRYMNSPFKIGAEEVKERLCLYNTITNVSSCIIKREYALRALDGLDKFKTCGDWIFYVRVLQYGNLAYSPTKMNYYRWHPSSTSFSASRTTSYVSEGIHVIRCIDYSIIHFSVREYLSVFKGWLMKIFKVKIRYMPGPMWMLLLATFKFLTAKVSFKN